MLLLGRINMEVFRASQKATRRYDHLVKYLVKFIKRHAGTADPITSIVVAKNMGAGMHKDKYNIHGKRNIVISLGGFTAGDLWVEGEHEEFPSQARERPDGVETKGSLIPISGRVVKFDPRRWHQSTPWCGTKWSVIGYCNRGFNRLCEEDVRELQDYGFPLPPRDSTTLSRMRLQSEVDEYDYYETTDEEEIVAMGRSVCEDELVLLRSALDEEERLEGTMSSSDNQDELQAVIEANAGIMKRCTRLESVAQEEFQKDDVSDSMEWFRLCRMVEGDEQHGVEEVLRNLQSPYRLSIRCL